MRAPKGVPSSWWGQGSAAEREKGRKISLERAKEPRGAGVPLDAGSAKARPGIGSTWDREGGPARAGWDGWDQS